MVTMVTMVTTVTIVIMVIIVIKLIIVIKIKHWASYLFLAAAARSRWRRFLNQFPTCQVPVIHNPAMLAAGGGGGGAGGEGEEGGKQNVLEKETK